VDEKNRSVRGGDCHRDIVEHLRGERGRRRSWGRWSCELGSSGSFLGQSSILGPSQRERR
jgi:hypothetical protein